MPSRSEGKPEADNPLDSHDIGDSQAVDPLAQVPLADGRQLVGHCLALLAADPDISLGGIEPADVARQRHDLHADSASDWRCRC
jgi:hypothetical protein